MDARLAIIVLVLVLCFQIGVIADAMGAKDLRADRPTPVIFNGFTALIIGIQMTVKREWYLVHSDTLMLLRVQPRTGGVVCCRFPRYPGRGA
jgi:hypothetical protein